MLSTANVGLWVVPEFCKSSHILLFTSVLHCYTVGITVYVKTFEGENFRGFRGF